MTNCPTRGRSGPRAAPTKIPFVDKGANTSFTASLRCCPPVWSRDGRSHKSTILADFTIGIASKDNVARSFLIGPQVCNSLIDHLNGFSKLSHGVSRAGEVQRHQNDGNPLPSSQTNSCTRQICLRALDKRHQSPMQDDSRCPVVCFITHHHMATFGARVSLQIAPLLDQAKACLAHTVSRNRSTDSRAMRSTFQDKPQIPLASAFGFATHSMATDSVWTATSGHIRWISLAFHCHPLFRSYFPTQTSNTPLQT